MLATALCILTAALSPAHAQEPETPQRNTLDVTGVGEVYVEPDEAVLTLGVRAEADTAARAFETAAELMTAVQTALAGQVEPERIRTSQLSLQPRYTYNEKTGPKLTGYEASSILEIRVDDPMNTGSVLDAAVAAGANEVLGVNWRIEDEGAARQEALDAAVADARTNAEQVANDLGVTLKEPARVSIRTEDTTPGPYYLERGAAMDAEAAQMPVSAGEQIYRAQVDVTFLIEGDMTPAAPTPPEEEPPEVEPTEEEMEPAS